ncbi:uncharacterized protein N7518_002350 [Penicillium psychrosexuale]|uniref:uncharacterized protein n=1 Tax=Penicillium psychrosexuale TaxID=1002107 RepID=UPI002545AB29|nr:uncharacterized protein N7518_002350 [Penicillium psychrosexuale]KAJ5800282.1 hypothetical protein N7518_002350 [Penicillium psychrosexuale]
MFANSLFSWFSSKESIPTSTSDATTGTENHQPVSPKAPSTDPMVTEQPNSQENMLKLELRGGGTGDVCCGLCAGLLCFECCECCECCC